MRRQFIVMSLIFVLAPAWCSAVSRDVVATAWHHPFLTDAEIGLHLSDTRAIIESDGGPTLIRYPGVQAVRVGGETLSAERVGPNLGRVTLPAGRQEVELLAGEPFSDEPLTVESEGPLAQTPDALAAMVAEAEPGDEVVIADGVHRGWRTTIEAHGTAEAPVVVRAQTPGGAIFQGDTALTLGGDYVVLRGLRFEHCGPGTCLYLGACDDSRVTQCQFYSCGNPRATSGHIFSVLMGSDRNRVDHCFFTGSKSMSLGQRIGDTGDVGTDNRYDHNTFRDIYRYSSNGQENIQIGQNQRDRGDRTPRAVVELNLFDNAWGDGEIISNKSSENIIRHNLAAHCQRASFTLRGGSDVRFEGNVVVDCAGGIRVIGTRHQVVNNLFMDNSSFGVRMETGTKVGRLYVAADDALIANNTILNCPQGILAVEPNEERPFVPQNCRVIDNLVTGPAGIMMKLDALEGATVRRNLVWTQGVGLPGTAGEGVIAEDPLLVGEGVDLRPASDSPAVDAALALDEVTDDRWNRQRPWGNGPDIGADEVGAPEAEDRPLLPMVPPEPVFAPELQRGELHYSSGDEPLELTDEGHKIGSGLPGDFVLALEHRAQAWGASGTVTLTGPDGEGWALRWSGLAEDGGPAGTVDLLDAASGEVLAQSPDIINPWRSYRGGGEVRLPDGPPTRTKRISLIKRADTLYVTLEEPDSGQRVPVMLWHGHGTAPRAPLTLHLDQEGSGEWRNINVWEREYIGDIPPTAPPFPQAQAMGAGRIRLTWGDNTWTARDFAVDIYRSREADFEPSADTMVRSDAVGGAWNDFRVEPGVTYHYALRARNVLGLTSDFVRVEAQAATGGPTYIFIPAASVAQIEPPLTLTEGDDGTFLWAPGASPNMQEAPTEGLARYEFNLPEAGEWGVWALVQAMSKGSDSYWVRVDDGPWKGWGTGLHPRWGWARAFEALPLDAGAHTITFGTREPGAKMGSLLISSDPELNPNR